MVIRQAILTDAPALARLRWDFQREEEDSPPVTTKVDFIKFCTCFFEKSIVSGTWHHWLAEINGKPIAHASLQQISMIPRPNRLKDTLGYLTNVYTIPDYRNQGLGTKLIQQIKDWSISEDLELAIVWPSEKSNSFYQRLGFKPSEEIMELGFRSY